MSRSALALVAGLLIAHAAFAEDETEAVVRTASEELLRMDGSLDDTGILALTAEAAERQTGELAGSLGYRVLSEYDALVDRVIVKSPERAAARIVAATGRDDWFKYFYLAKQGDRWKLAAIREFGDANEVAEMRRALRQTHDLPADFGSRLQDDRSLSAWFEAHRSELEQIAAEPPDARATTLCRELGLGSIEREGGARIVIGNVSGSTVGFGFSPAAPPPEIHPNDYIWVEPLGGGWFLFRKG